MKVMILVIMIVCLTVFLTCCGILSPDEKLTLQRKDYHENRLKINGYYYYLAPNGNTAIYFLYRNGIILSMGSYLTHDLDDIEKKMVNKDFKSKDHWGVFIINSDSIQYEKWVGSTGFSACLFRSIGYIENDTTIHFTESYYSETKTSCSIDEVWYFKPFANKPDSTNVYIK